MTRPFTPTFIEMAKAAEEIQAMRPGVASFQNGDWFLALVQIFSREWGSNWMSEKPEDGKEVFAAGSAHCMGDAEWDEGSVSVSGYADYCAPLEDRNLIAFIPRLDQLLGMLGSAHDFGRYLRGLSYEDVNIEETGECRDWHELAISGVMREKYSKVWDGKGWVKS